MKNPTNGALRRLCVLAGVCLLVSAIGTLAFWQWRIHDSAAKAEYYVTALRTRIPEPQGAVPEERRDNTMAALQQKDTSLTLFIKNVYAFEYIVIFCDALS